MLSCDNNFAEEQNRRCIYLTVDHVEDGGIKIVAGPIHEVGGL